MVKLCSGVWIAHLDLKAKIPCVCGLTMAHDAPARIAELDIQPIFSSLTQPNSEGKTDDEEEATNNGQQRRNTFIKHPHSGNKKSSSNSKEVVQIASCGPRLKDIRIGLTLSWVFFLQVIHLKYLHPDSELQNFALQVMEMLRVDSSADAQALVIF
ncbi:Protein SWEETIE [Camellia lanceoleosa]|uniref:Protein SWEETIE n=1 Tax=Camellia lanceoleosa TaxID=1840588 RepID=A0ACC0IVN5_9ERIC|nr:Protein SWEETIE [Camellia lanceoleosa]